MRAKLLQKAKKYLKSTKDRKPGVEKPSSLSDKFPNASKRKLKKMAKAFPSSHEIDHSIYNTTKGELQIEKDGGTVWTKPKHKIKRNYK
jgi:hypothetical protein